MRKLILLLAMAVLPQATAQADHAYLDEDGSITIVQVQKDVDPIYANVRYHGERRIPPGAAWYQVALPNPYGGQTRVLVAAEESPDAYYGRDRGLFHLTAGRFMIDVAFRRNRVEVDYKKGCGCQKVRRCRKVQQCRFRKVRKVEVRVEVGCKVRRHRGENRPVCLSPHESQGDVPAPPPDPAGPPPAPAEVPSPPEV